MPDAALKKLVLVDAYSLLFRAHFANPYLSTADGKPTGALFGFGNMLLSLLTTQKPDSVVICWDAPEKTLRKQEFEAYKAHRPEVDPQLIAQMPEARRLVEAFGIQSAEVGGYEADDLIGTLSVRGADDGMSVVILTGDSDQLQLVRDGVCVEMSRRGVTDVKTYDASAVLERYGVAPARIPDWKGLVGDTSDNIPGVPGIGEKTATALLQAWDTIENLLDHVPEVTPNKARLALEQNANQARLSKRLATIVCDAPIDIEIRQYDPGPTDWQNVRELFEELQFKSLLARLPKAETPPPKSETHELVMSFDDDTADATKDSVHCIETAEQLRAVIEAPHPAGPIALTVDKAAGAAIHAAITALGFARSGGDAYSVRVRSEPGQDGASSLFDEEPDSDEEFAATSADLKALLSPRSISNVNDKALPVHPNTQHPTPNAQSIICHNAKFVLQALENAAVPQPKVEFDTMVAAYVLDSGRSTYPLEDLALKYLADRDDSQPSSDAPAGERLAREAALILRLAEPMREQIKKLGMQEVMDRVDLPLVPVLAEVECAGLLIDRPYLSTLSIRLNRDMDGLASEIYSLAGEEFNIGSTKQLQTVLFDKLQLPTGKKTKTGYSTGADLLEQLAAEFPIARKIIDYREISKLKATYADSLVKLADPQTGRVHTTLSQTVASTGRLSSSDPNLQNIPIKSELGREIRRAFVAPNGRVLLSCDYSQIELRVLAHMSGDTALTEAFVSHADVHAATAARVFGVDLADVSADQRRRAKTINFAVIYGQSAFALAATLGVDTKTAGEWIKEYFNNLPGVQRFIAETTASARTNKYVTTLMGRRRYLPELESPNHSMRQFAERAAVNMPIQGTAADIMKLAMIEVFHEVKRNWSARCKMLLQVHDELLFEVDEGAVADVTPVIRKIMEGVYPLSVPFTADAKVGPNWADMKGVSSKS
jgi:DNA polymerase-1